MLVEYIFGESPSVHINQLFFGQMVTEQRRRESNNNNNKTQYRTTGKLFIQQSKFMQFERERVHYFCEFNVQSSVGASYCNTLMRTVATQGHTLYYITFNNSLLLLSPTSSSTIDDGSNSRSGYIRPYMCILYCSIYIIQFVRS